MTNNPNYININNKGLYIHIPYCKRKCLYCSFYSVTAQNVSDTLFFAMLNEISSYQNQNIHIDTIYIGGGTPSLLSQSQLVKLFNCLHKSFVILPNAEISIEINPDTATQGLFECLASLGVNRVSFGVQSFIDSELIAIGRLHNADKAIKSINLAKGYFNNINLDLMFALPNQTIDSFAKSLQIAATLGVQHISAYSLILEENTKLYNMYSDGVYKYDDDLAVDMYDLAVGELAKYGYNRYEISNFAKNGFECKHNLNCWHFHEYIGIGAAAHSFFEGKRFSNVCDIDSYINNVSKTYYPTTKIDLLEEYLMLALRLATGVDKEDFKLKTGCDFDLQFASQLQSEVIKKTCVNNPTTFYVKPEYFYVVNNIILQFFDFN